MTNRRKFVNWLDLVMLLGWLTTFSGVGSAQVEWDSESTVSVNGIEMHYRTHGSGPPLLLLHGFFNTGEGWAPFVPEFAEHYRLIVPDLRGHGGSTNPHERYVHDQAASDILALLDFLELEKVRAIGHSSGAMTLLDLASRQPGRIEALVVLGGTMRNTETAREIQRTLLSESVPPEGKGRLKAWHSREGQLDALFRQFQAIAENGIFETRPELMRIMAPTLIIHGDRDEHFPMRIAMEMHRAIPQAYLWVVPNGNHMLIFDFLGGDLEGSFPGEAVFSDVVIDFLEEGWSAD